MIAPLEGVLNRLSEKFGIEAAERLVTRADSRPVRGAASGEHALTLELETPGGRRWFRFEREHLSELEPQEDARLPLTSRWDTLAAEGAIELLAWRPGRRMAFMHGRVGGTVVVKALRKGRAERTAAMHRIALAALDAGPVRAPALLDCDSRSESVSFEREEGEPFELDCASADDFFQIGTALRHLQGASASPDLPLHGPVEELEVLDGCVSKARLWNASSPAGWEEARAELVRSPLPQPADGPVLAHRDLHDGQFVATASGLVLLDFDLLCLADPVLDAANLTAHVSLRMLQGCAGTTDARADTWLTALLAGLDRGKQDTPAFRFYLAATYLRLAALYSLRPRWAHLDAGLVALARQALGSSVRA